MAYTETIAFTHKAAASTVGSFTGQLIDTTGQAVGSPITSGFAAGTGYGNWLITLTRADDFSGALEIFHGNVPVGVVGIAALNPPMVTDQRAALLDHLDAAISSVPTLPQIAGAIDEQSMDMDAVIARLDTLTTRLTSTRAALLDNLDAPVSTRTTLGAGSIQHTHTVYSGSDVVAGAKVWVTTDVAGEETPVASGVSDTFGRVRFLLDAGVYYVWAKRAGVNIVNPVEITVA